MDTGLWILIVLVAILAAIAYRKDPSLPAQGVRSAALMFRSVGVEILLGFLLTGLMAVLIPAATLKLWLGEGTSAKGILMAWAAGLLLPGGPYVFFPMAAGLLAKGVAPGALMTLLAAKTLASPLRALTYEAPVLGWPMTLARLIPGVLAAPLLGLAGVAVLRILGEAKSG
jgi:uncharacterized protein